MDSFFSVNKNDLKRLSASEAVDRFRELLWAEATTLGIGKHLINVPTAITVSDGGIDAEVRDVTVNGGQGIIKNGLTCYQIKTGNYSLRVKDNVKKILYTPKSNGTELEPKVQACLDKGGTLIIVLFEWDKPENKDKDNEFPNLFREELAKFDLKYIDAKIEVWQPNKLMGFFNSYPSLALRVRGVENALFQSHKSWSLNDDMNGSFERGDEQNKFIAELCAGLRQDNEAVHIHVMGEPGIGKTRYVLEATDDRDLAPLVIYCSHSENFQDSNLMNELLMEDNHFAAILVLDECDNESRYYIWNKLKRRGSRIKLVSIYSEFSSDTGNTKLLFIPPLDKSLVSNIIQNYGIVKDQANRWSELCDGSPRVAHVLGWNLNRNPEDLLKPLGTFPLWERYIAAGDKGNSEEVRQRRLVLQYIALFKRFGYKRPVDVEATAIAKLIERDEPNITHAKFQAIVKSLMDRKILQGSHTLYITPKAFHIKLWIDWWETYGNSFDFDEFSSNLTEQLKEWFYEMFIYAAQSETATTIVIELLGNNGPFQDDSYLQTKLGARFFLALTEAEPKAALSYLKRTIGNWNKEKLLTFTTGRREVVWALEKIAMWREYFIDATHLLLSLGEAENESWTNNASGIFVELFSLGTDELAPTQASAEERLPILKETLQSSVKEQRLLAIRACNKALESQHFFRDVGAEYQGLRRVPNLWMPKTYGELFDAYRQVWQLLYTQLKYAPEDERQLIIDILLQRAQGLARYVALADMAIDTVDELIHRPDTDKKKILADIVRILHYDGKQIPEHIRQRWEQLKNSLVGTDFSSRMKRYVGMDLLEDSFDEQGNHGDQIQPQIVELAQQVIENPALLDTELHWLVTNEAQNGYRFGYELGKRDASFSLLPALLDAQRHAENSPSVFFLGGYLRVLFEKDQPQWEEQADVLANDETLRIWLPELTFRSGLSDRAASRLVKLITENVINAGHFRLFGYGRAIQLLSEEVFQTWIVALLSSSHPDATSIALDLYYIYYVEQESSHILPEQLTQRLLTLPSWLIPVEGTEIEQMDYYRWTEVGKAFARIYPERSLLLADWVLEYFGATDTILESSSGTLAVLNIIVEQHPQDIWKLIISRLGPPTDARAFYIQRWLRGDDDSLGNKAAGMLSSFPLEIIWQWVNEDVEQRAGYLASFVPKTLFRDKEQPCIAREALVRYGEREDVRSAFSANYFTGMWWGPQSMHYEKVKQKLLDFKKEEDNKNVKRWVDDYLEELDNYIQQAKLREERDTF